MANKRALITGVLGQDGSFMAELLAQKGYDVYGIVRYEPDTDKIEWIQKLIPSIKISYVNILCQTDLYNEIELIKPDEIYNFAGYSNVFNPYLNPELVFDINAKVPQYILEVIQNSNKIIKFFNASSCLIFGRDKNEKQNESTHANPKYQYGISKLYANNIVNEYREEWGIFACSGIFYPHESERRGDLFFTKKIIKAALDIYNRKADKFNIGSLDSFRDFGYAPDYMEAVYLMMQNSTPKDYVIGTGILTKLRDFVKLSFDKMGLNYEDYICPTKELTRDNDVNILCADASKIKKELRWYPKVFVPELISIMLKKCEVI